MRDKFNVGMTTVQAFSFLFAWITVAVATYSAFDAGRMMEFYWLLLAEVLLLMSAGLTIIRAILGLRK